MPIFEYKCNDCGHEFEELVLSNDDTISCKSCGSANTGKLMSSCRFKAGGAAPDLGGSSEQTSTPSAPSSPCATCSGGDCSSCS